MIKAHIFAQTYQHSDAYIVADDDALRAIIKAASAALYHTEHEEVALYCNDGEGYTLHIIYLDDEGRWKETALPYCDEDAAGNQDDKLFPWQLF